MYSNTFIFTPKKSTLSSMILIVNTIVYLILSVYANCVNSSPIQWSSSPYEEIIARQYPISVDDVSDLSSLSSSIVNRMDENNSDVDIKSILDQSTNSRKKRSGIADQRLAELEAYEALRRRLQKMKGQTHGFGQFDFDRIGKRRRRDRQMDGVFSA